VVRLLQEEFEATNACVYEMEKRLEERFVEVRADVSLATAECKQQTLSEVVYTTSCSWTTCSSVSITISKVSVQLLVLNVDASVHFKKSPNGVY